MRWVLLSLGALLAAAGCGPRTDDAGPRLTVFGAASTTDVVTRLAKDYDHASVRSSFGASSALARQIEDGAPADVFISASRAWVRYLQERNLLDGAPVVFARGALVCVAPEDSTLAVDDARALAAALHGADRVAIADQGVPVGEYARESLEATEALAALEERLVGQRNARAVLMAVERGECAAGFVYATDAAAARVRTLFHLPGDSHAPIAYHAAVVKAGRVDEARRFLAFLRGPTARAVLEEAGFLLPRE